MFDEGGIMLGINHWEMFIVLFVALLLFGKRLPEVARSMGKGITEFKKGMKGLEDEVRNEVTRPSTPPRRPTAEDDEQRSTAPRFQPPALPPTAETEPVQQA